MTGVIVDLVDIASTATEEVDMLWKDDVGPGSGGSLVDEGMFERVETGGSTRVSEVEGWFGSFGAIDVVIVLAETASAMIDEKSVLDNEVSWPGGGLVGASLGTVGLCLEELELVVAGSNALVVCRTVCVTTETVETLTLLIDVDEVSKSQRPNADIHPSPQIIGPSPLKGRQYRDQCTRKRQETEDSRGSRFLHNKTYQMPPKPQHCPNLLPSQV